MDSWDKPLTFVITPKSGPLRKMVRLHDAQQALITDLPPGYLKRTHWLRAGKALVTAAETGKSRDIECAFEAIVAALDEEGWLPQGASCVPLPRSVDSSNITPRPPGEPLWRRGAFEAVVAALDEEGWLAGLSSTPTKPLRYELPCYEPPPSVPSNVRAPVRNITPGRAAEPLWRRIHPVGTNGKAAEGEQQASASLNPAPKSLEQFVREHLLFLPGSDG